MPIPVKCSMCGRKSRVNDSKAGKTIRCKDCGEPIRVKGSASGGGSSVPIPLIIVVCVMVGVGGAVAMNFTGGKKENDRGERLVANGGGFAPGGQEVDVSNARNVVEEAENSRFNNVDLGNSSNNASSVKAAVQRRSVKKHPSMGMGFGDVIGVMEYWKKQNSNKGKEGEYLKFQEEPDALPPISWTVEVDPPQNATSEELVESAQKTLRAGIPKGSQRASSSDIVFCVSNPHMVAVGQNAEAKDRRDVWDLKKGQKIATISGIGVKTEKNAISPNGDYYAGVVGRVRDLSIGVWDVQNNKPLVDIDCGDIWGFDFIAIPSPDRLVGYGGTGNKSLMVWELPSGTPVHTLELGWGRMEGRPTFSPGGKYMAIVQDENWQRTIAVYDLELGFRVGDLAYPDYDITFLKTPGLAFSQDGTELAGIMGSGNASKIIIWDVATGDIKDHLTFEKPLAELAVPGKSGWDKFNPLSFFPDGKRLLAYEHAVIDREVGAIVWQIPTSSTSVTLTYTRWPTSPNHVTVVDVSRSGSGSVLNYKLPEDKIAKAKEMVKKRMEASGPKTPTFWVDQGIPSPANWNGSTYVVPERVAWSAQPDPLEVPPAADNYRPMKMNLTRGTLREVAVSSGESPRVVALRSSHRVPFQRLPIGNVSPNQLKSYRWHAKEKGNDSTFAAESSNKSRAWVDVYDLTTGELLRELKLKYEGELLGVSPSGDKFAIMAGQQANRIDIYNTEDGSHVAGWVPYASSGGELEQLLMMGIFATDEQFITMSGTGQLAVWNIDEASVLFSVDGTAQPALSPGRKYLGYSDGESYYLSSMTDGAVKGAITDVGNVKAVSFSPDGTKLALLSEHKGGYYLFSTDLATGTVSKPFPVPVISGHLKWCGDRYVLIDNSKLVDMEQKAVAWSYELASGDHVPTLRFDDRQWFVADANGTPILNSVPVPDPSAMSKLAAATLQPEFVLQPGGKCSLEIRIGSPTSGDFSNKVRDLYTKKLQENGITVESGQPVKLVATLDEKSGEQVTRTYHTFGIGGDTEVSYTQKTATTKVAFVVTEVACWEKSGSYGNGSFFVNRKEGQSIEDALSENYKGSVEGFFNGVQLPPYVFTPRSANGIGTSMLSAGGGVAR